MIDLRCERFLIRRKRGRQSGKANEDGKREFESGFPLIRIRHNLKQSGAIAAFWGGAPCPVGSQWDQSPYLQIDHHVSARGFASLVLQRPWGPLNRCCPRANTFLFCMNFLKNVLTIASAARFSHQTVEVRSKGLTVMYVDQPDARPIISPKLADRGSHCFAAVPSPRLFQCDCHFFFERPSFETL